MQLFDNNSQISGLRSFDSAYLCISMELDRPILPYGYYTQKYLLKLINTWFGVEFLTSWLSRLLNTKVNHFCPIVFFRRVLLKSLTCFNRRGHMLYVCFIFFYESFCWCFNPHPYGGPKTPACGFFLIAFRYAVWIFFPTWPEHSLTASPCLYVWHMLYIGTKEQLREKLSIWKWVRAICKSEKIASFCFY